MRERDAGSVFVFYGVWRCVHEGSREEIMSKKVVVARSGEYCGEIARPFAVQGKSSSSSSSSLCWVVSQGSVDMTSSKRSGHGKGGLFLRRGRESDLSKSKKQIEWRVVYS
ncbi:hypothetical protein LR48_Vigan04g192500 [Vigna angularis]|uniref:Uncharacterized protein n=1 Tax=Phaseolus angularis TaxID=3914 RepID=A0A0L9UGN9_PHAAN|nr:uncharacterized protein HKW66_Vig0101720 [Vigna angularis]KOM41727.1 hypothetical protein LR48_Vigan04g192500 [Vigna angularis]